MALPSAEESCDIAMAVQYESLRERVVRGEIPRSDAAYRAAVAGMESRARRSAFKVEDVVYGWDRIERSLTRSKPRSPVRPGGVQGGHQGSNPRAGVRVYRQPDEWGPDLSDKFQGIAG